MIEIDLASIDHNVRVVRRVVGGGCAVCGVVKADAYGLGAVPIARHLERAGVAMLAVYNTDQAGELFAAAIRLPVLVLMPVRELVRTSELYRAMVDGRLHFTVHDEEHLETITALAERFGARLPVHVVVDVGMSRGGCPPDEAAIVMRRIAERHRLVLAGVATHFPSADADPALTEAQLEEFEALLESERDVMPAGCLVHAANTFATFRHRRFHKSMVRVGLAWAGYGAEMMRGASDGDLERLRPVVRWSSRIIHVKSIPTGAGVGYGHRWSADRPSRLGVVPVGYADGYPAALTGPSGAEPPAHVGVHVGGAAGETTRYAPVVGAVSMDQITVDLTDLEAQLPEGVEPPGVGTVVELVSPDPSAPNHLARVAAAAGMVPHVLLCGLGAQVPRRHVAASAAVHVAPARVVAPLVGAPS
ncbi:MAG: alanine racemase [Planctomycetota bacterium]|jgi:alanine racemase